MVGLEGGEAGWKLTGLEDPESFVETERGGGLWVDLGLVTLARTSNYILVSGMMTKTGDC